MQQTITEKIFSDHIGKEVYAGEIVDSPIDMVIGNDITTPLSIKAFEERLESVFNHKRLQRRVSYRTAIKLDCYKLIKYIMEDKPFTPFTLKEGV